MKKFSKYLMSAATVTALALYGSIPEGICG